MTVSRRDMERAATMALATISASETPEWLRTMAFQTYEDMAWNLQFNRECADPDDRETWLMAYLRTYEVEVRHFLARLPIEVKDADKVDVLLAVHLAKGIDTHEMTTTARLECMCSLYRTLRRLHRALLESGLSYLNADNDTEPFDSVFDDPNDFLKHLAANCVGHDDDEDDDFEHERSTNGTDYIRID